MELKPINIEKRTVSLLNNCETLSYHEPHFLFDDKRKWYGANWAGRHLVYLILRFLPNGDHIHLAEYLQHVNDFPGCKVDLSSLDFQELKTLRTTHGTALAALKQAGPKSELFHDLDFFPRFLAKFEEFGQLVADKISSFNETRV